MNHFGYFCRYMEKAAKMSKREFKDKVYGELARITRALANPHRLEIIELLAQGAYSVEQISIQTSLSVANTSQHLQILRNAQLLEMTRNGNFIHYRLADQKVFRAWKALRDLGVERIATIDKLLTDFRKSKSNFEPVTIDQLVGKIHDGSVTILDVRPAGEYKNGRIARALSIPFDELAERINELPKENEIIAYCRGPFCVYADDAVSLLNASGYKATRLKEGFPDWALLGLPVEAN